MTAIKPPTLSQTPLVRRGAVASTAIPTFKPVIPRPDVDATRVRAAIVKPKKAVIDTTWYKIKRTLANFLCNLPIPSMTTRSLGEGVPEGLQAKMKPGDVLLRRTEGTSGNLFIPSWWKHAAVYIGDGKISEATFHGVQISTLDEFFKGGDHATVLSPKDLTDAQRQKAADFAKSLVGKPYDFDMEFTDDGRYSCTELASTAMKVAAGKRLVELGKWTGAVVGDDFLNGKFDVRYTSSPEHMNPN